MLVTIFAVLIPVLPAAGFTTWPSLILPTVTIAILQIALISRMVRREMVSAFASPYITVARSRGVSERELTWRYAMRNSAIPIVTALGTRFAGNAERRRGGRGRVRLAWCRLAGGPRTRDSRLPAHSGHRACHRGSRSARATGSGPPLPPPGSTRATRKGRQLMTTVLEPPTTPRASAVTEADFARAGATRRKRDSRVKNLGRLDLRAPGDSSCCIGRAAPPCRSEPDQPEQSTATAPHRRPSVRHRSVGTRSALTDPARRPGVSDDRYSRRDRLRRHRHRRRIRRGVLRWLGRHRDLPPTRSTAFSASADDAASRCCAVRPVHSRHHVCHRDRTVARSRTVDSLIGTRRTRKALRSCSSSPRTYPHGHPASSRHSQHRQAGIARRPAAARAGRTAGKFV